MLKVLVNKINKSIFVYKLAITLLQKYISFLSFLKLNISNFGTSNFVMFVLWFHLKMLASRYAIVFLAQNCRQLVTTSVYYFLCKTTDSLSKLLGKGTWRKVKRRTFTACSLYTFWELMRKVRRNLLFWRFGETNRLLWTAKLLRRFEIYNKQTRLVENYLCLYKCTYRSF